jgi:hypothetical protein
MSVPLRVLINVLKPADTSTCDMVDSHGSCCGKPVPKGERECGKPPAVSQIPPQIKPTPLPQLNPSNEPTASSRRHHHHRRHQEHRSPILKPIPPSLIHPFNQSIGRPLQHHRLSKL